MEHTTDIQLDKHIPWTMRPHPKFLEYRIKGEANLFCLPTKHVVARNTCMMELCIEFVNLILQLGSNGALSGFICTTGQENLSIDLMAKWLS